jgi:hypothetical protein
MRRICYYFVSTPFMPQALYVNQIYNEERCIESSAVLSFSLLCSIRLKRASYFHPADQVIMHLAFVYGDGP